MIAHLLVSFNPVTALHGEENCDKMSHGGIAMRDFPMFTTEYGAASLVLREIPYQQAAYVTVLDSREPEKLLQECVSFCRVCGAESVFATGHDFLRKFPLHTALWEMRCATDIPPDTDAALFPVQETTLEAWREIYNQKVTKVPAGAWMTQKAAKEMLNSGGGYFVHRDGKLLGIGLISDGVIQWVASVQRGAGADVVCALIHATTEDTVSLTVASTNDKAVALYEKLGFMKVLEQKKWYLVHGATDR